jgi:hypothetical protein
MRIIRIAWKSFVTMSLAVAAIICNSLLSGLCASADPIDVMRLGEFTTQDWFVQTGCVSYDPHKPSYINFSSIYIGTEDAALQLEHLVNGQWVTPSSDSLRISVGSDEQDQRQSFASLAGGARQMVDITVLYVQPNELLRLVGRHVPSGQTTLLAAWSAAERNECSAPPVKM